MELFSKHCDFGPSPKGLRRAKQLFDMLMKMADDRHAALIKQGWDEASINADMHRYCVKLGLLPTPIKRPIQRHMA
jgi:hypothetical protein